MNIFALFEARVREAVEALTRAGQLPEGLDLARVVVEPPRDPTHGDLATNAAMVLAKEARTNPRALGEALAAELRADPRIVGGRASPGPGFINLRLAPAIFHDVLRGALADPDGFGRAQRRRRAGQRRVRLGQPDRPDACRPRPRRGVRRRAVQPPGRRRPAGHARILHQRRRRAGRRARPLRLPALPRGAGRAGRPIPEGLYPGDYLKPVGARARRDPRPRAPRQAGGANGCRSCARPPSP